MNNYIINREDAFENILNKEHYFQSLLQLLHSNNLLSINEIENIQFQVLDVLKEIVSYYTKNESYSVKVEVAEQIMLSIYYTIGICLKDKSTLKERIALLKDKDVKHLFSKGEELLKIKIEETKKLLEVVQRTKIRTDNYAYVDTIDYGIPLFFKEYNLRFASHETPGSIDYPLAIDEMDLVGIEYINEYLNKIYLENMFCSHFNDLEIEALLKGFDKNCDHMLINIFELVLINYCGRIFLGKEGRNLDITEYDRYSLKNKMEKLQREEINNLMSTINQKLCYDFSIQDKYFNNYIGKTIFKFIPQIKSNIDNDKVENIFITLNYSKDNLIKYEDGKVIDDSKFRSIVEEIRACNEAKDKIKIIREEIHSLKDLVDILSADCIFPEEFINIYRALDDFEIALLLKHIPNDKAMDYNYGTDIEKEWQEKFKEYLATFDEVKRKKIVEISQGIDIEKF